MDSATFQKALEISNKISDDLKVSPTKYRVFTGDRPTGNLHLGHYFGSLKNRIKLQKMGIELYILIADYQVLTDHESFDKISQNTKELVIDYLSTGINPNDDKTCIFPHSYIPELNQLLVPFLTLISVSELERNPTVKEEIQTSKLKTVNAGMLVYPIHQAADILSVNANLVPVGKDQLPHIEVARLIAKRFNSKFGKVFVEPHALLSATPSIVGLDGQQKMSKSRNNSIMLKATREEIISVVSKAKTDSDKHITFDPINRPEISNLLSLVALMAERDEIAIADDIGNGGAKKLKELLIETTDNFLKPIRQKRKELENNPEFIKQFMLRSIDKVREEASKTLNTVRKFMNMEI